jgi:hypothetical protein
MDKKPMPQLTGLALQPRPKAEGSPLEELPGKGMPLFSRPFTFASNQRPKILKALDGEPAAASTGDVIQERNGVHFINTGIFNPGKDTEKNLDSGFKNLVDSVLGKK